MIVCARCFRICFGSLTYSDDLSLTTEIELKSSTLSWKESNKNCKIRSFADSIDRKCACFKDLIRFETFASMVVFGWLMVYGLSELPRMSKRHYLMSSDYVCKLLKLQFLIKLKITTLCERTSSVISISSLGAKMESTLCCSSSTYSCVSFYPMVIYLHKYSSIIYIVLSSKFLMQLDFRLANSVLYFKVSLMPYNLNSTSSCAFLMRLMAM